MMKNEIFPQIQYDLNSLTPLVDKTDRKDGCIQISMIY